MDHSLREQFHDGLPDAIAQIVLRQEMQENSFCTTDHNKQREEKENTHQS